MTALSVSPDLHYLRTTTQQFLVVALPHKYRPSDGGDHYNTYSAKTLLNFGGKLILLSQPDQNFLLSLGRLATGYDQHPGAGQGEAVVSKTTTTTSKQVVMEISIHSGSWKEACTNGSRTCFPHVNEKCTVSSSGGGHW